ncbi:MAG: hypothetical protein WAR83_00905 [Flavobacteriales bacterium]|nr:hypothetical protein [Flavobacteriales bacterium]
MNTIALTLMVSVQLLVVGLAVYFFFKVLTVKPKPEPDSFTDNDPA